EPGAAARNPGSPLHVTFANFSQVALDGDGGLDFLNVAAANADEEIVYDPWFFGLQATFRRSTTLFGVAVKNVPTFRTVGVPNGVHNVIFLGTAGDDVFHADQSGVDSAGVHVEIPAPTSAGEPQFNVQIDGGEGSDTSTADLDSLGNPFTVGDTGTTGTDAVKANGTDGNEDIHVAGDIVRMFGYSGVRIGPGIEALGIDAMDGDDTVDVAPLPFTPIQVDGGAGNDSFILDPLSLPFQVVGGSYLVQSHAPVTPINFEQETVVGGSDTTPPVISNVQVVPSALPVAGGDILIRADVTDDSPLPVVQAVIQLPDATYLVLDMALGAARGATDGTYSTVWRLGPNLAGSPLTFSVSTYAQDEPGNQASSPWVDYTQPAGRFLPGGVATFALANVPAGPVTPLDVGLGLFDVFRYDPAAGQYRRLSPTDPLSVGTGYFVLHGDLPAPVAEPGLPPAGVENRTLGVGWNLIASTGAGPFLWNLNTVQVQVGAQVMTLGEAQAAGILPGYAWLWVPQGSVAGHYELIYDLEAIAGVRSDVPQGEAIWVLASQPCELLVTAETSLRRKAARSSGWELSVAAAGGTVKLGVGGQGALQAGLPPVSPNGARPAGVTLLDGSRALAADFKAGGKDRWEWSLQVTHGSGSEVAVTWPDLRAVPAGLSRTLVDEQTGASRSLRQSSGFVYHPAAGEASRRFRVIAERGAAALQVLGLQTRGGRARGLALSFTLTGPARSTVMLRSLGGRVVGVMEQGKSRAAGTNELGWAPRDTQGRPLPRGVYQVEVAVTDDQGRLARAIATVVVE
ncbi:MAG: hypothetical protein HYU66_03775, partial [Armatimonadetes bacterium]|nr:hypothetical protein [Armatimonadota bacterium]